MMMKGWISGDAETAFSLEYDTFNYALADATALFIWEGTWAFQVMQQNFADTGMEWDWTRLPTGEGIDQVYQLGIGENLSINAASEHPDAAAAVLDWLLNDKKRAAQIVEAFNFGEWVVPLKYTREDFSSAADERYIRYIEDFATVSGEGKVGWTSWTFYPAGAGEVLSREWDNIWTGEWTSQEFWEFYEAEYQPLYERGPVYPPPTTGTSP